MPVDLTLKDKFRKLQVIQKLAIGCVVVYGMVFFYLVILKNNNLTYLPVSAMKSESIESSQGVYMENLDRVEIKDGKKKWRIEATSANFREGNGNALLKEPTITVFDEDSPKPTKIYAKSALVKTDKNVLQSALLEGDVRMLTSSDVTVESQIAEYSSDIGKVFVPDHAKVTGSGYWVKGKTLTVFTELGTLEFGNEVESFFETANKSNGLTSLKNLKKL